MLRLIFLRDLFLSFRHAGGAFSVLAFFASVVLLFSFALGPEVLRVHAAAIAAAAVLLSMLLALPLVFERDTEDGTLEQYALLPIASEWLVASKIVAFWAAFLLPVIVSVGVVSVMAGVEAESWQCLVARLLLASPALAAFSVLGAALTLGGRGGGLAQALILLPLTMPPLIFVTAGGEGALPGLLLAGLSCAAMPLSCWVAGMLVGEG